MSESGGRTPEEREAARLEREARRAARAGGQKPPKSGGGPRRGLRGKGDSKVRPAAPGRNGGADRPSRAEPAPRAGRESPAEKPVPGGRSGKPPAADRATKPLPLADREQAAPAEPLPAVRRQRPRVDLERVRELTRRRRALRAPDATGDGDGGDGAPEKQAPSRRRRPRRVLIVALAVVGVALAWLLVSVFQPFKDDGEGRVQVSIPTGAGVGEIADLLDERGVISNPSFFEARVTLAGRRGDLKPGAYELRRDMSYGAVIDTLAAGPPDDVVRLVIPEGRSRDEVAELVKDAGLKGSYGRATVRSRELSPRRYGARRARSLEGFLFPATYELDRGASVRSLVRRQLQAFEREFDKVDLRAARRKNLTAYDVLVIASMVEREALLDRERRVIASVIYNRLSRGEPLGIDATIRFATRNWSEPLTESDLQLDSAYNTRRRAGLPPGPIGSPGLKSIRAAARPARTDFLFYVVKPDTCGEHAFSKTLAEFERDARRYDVERARRGGRSPTNC